MVLAALITGCGSASSSELPGAEACLALAEKNFGFVTVTARWQQGNITQNLPAFARLGLPAFCLVDAMIEPVAGSRIRNGRDDAGREQRLARRQSCASRGYIRILVDAVIISPDEARIRGSRKALEVAVITGAETEN